MTAPVTMTAPATTKAIHVIIGIPLWIAAAPGASSWGLLV
jgi:hypothetical protein